MARNSSPPYLSVVVATRNDDHGLNLLPRTQTFINALVNQSKRHDLSIELIVVEWNPPADRPRLLDVLRWPEDPSPCQIRIITVTGDLHQRYEHAAALPLFQMIAKNVGIRRARGRFVLATNIDILLSDELAEFLAAGKLETGKIYRTDRLDVMSDVPVDGSIFEQLDYCRTHLLRMNARDGTFPLRPQGDCRLPATDDIVEPAGGILPGPGWFLPMSRDSKQRVRLLQRDAVLDLVGPAESGQFLQLELEPATDHGYRPPIELQLRDRHGVVLGLGMVETRQRLYFPLAYQPGELQRLRLHVPQATGCPHDSMTAALRVFSCAWSRPPLSQSSPTDNNAGITEHLFKSPLAKDVAEPDSGIRFGGGWWKPESEPRGLFRWADGDAWLEVEQADADLCLNIAPGPSVGWGPFELEVTDVYSGRVIAQGIVKGRSLVRLKLPVSAARTRQIRLRAPGSSWARASVEDSRVLNFRIYHCFWSKPEANSPAFRSGPALSPANRLGHALLAALRALPRRAGLMRRRLLSKRPAVSTHAPATAESRRGLPFPLHTNACGDFTLLAAEHWRALRAYPEFEMYSLHVDSLLCYMAAAAGLEEVVLEQPMCAYHIEHSLGSGSTPEGESLLLERMARRGIPVLSWPQVTAWGFAMRQHSKPTIYNDEHWGLGQMNLEETLVHASLPVSPGVDGKSAKRSAQPST